MTFKEYQRSTAKGRIESFLEARGKALRRKIKPTVTRFCNYAAHQRREHGSRWPFDFTPKARDIAKLVDYLLDLRAEPTPDWMRGPWIETQDGDRIRTKLPNDSDAEPENCGEEFAFLLRKYWMLVFGFQDGKTSVTGIGRVIFESNKIDNLTVALLIGDSTQGSALKIAALLKPAIDQVNRSLAPTRKQRAETVRQKIRDLEKPRRK